jgi:hypothetical protein
MAKTIFEQLEETRQQKKDYFNKNKKHKDNWKVQEHIQMLNVKIARLENECAKNNLTFR